MEKVIMVEHINDFGEWVWYAVCKNATMRTALQYYASENGLKGDAIIERSDALYLGDDIAKAYEITIIDLKK